MSAAEPLRPPPNRVRRRVRPEIDLEEPIRGRALQRRTAGAARPSPRRRADGHDRPPRAAAPSVRGSPRTAASCSSPTAPSPGRSRTSERSRRPPNGSSTTSTVVDEQLREIRDDLPADYYRELPEARRRPSRRAIRGSSASPGRTSPTPTAASSRTACGGWSRAYQEVEPLTVGELWAIAISLRFLLVENLRRLAVRIVRSRADRQRADEFADSLLGLGRDAPDDAAAALRRLSRGVVLDRRPGPAVPAAARPGPGGDARPPLARGPCSRPRARRAEEIVRARAPAPGRR